MTSCKLDPAFDELVQRHPEKALRSWSRLQEAIDRDGILFGNGSLPACLKPHFIPKLTHDRWVADSEALSVLLEDLGELIFKEKDLRGRFGLPQEAEDLLAIDPGYDRVSVVCRPDCIWRGDDLFVVEINSDSPAMMTFTDYLERLMMSIFPSSDLQNPERVAANRTSGLHDALVACHRERGGTGSPTIAIVDWDDVKTLHEQRLTAREFTSLGSDSFACDPRELKVEHGRLVARGRKIDVVYRRVLFMDFLRRKEELKPLLDAYRDGLVCMVNPLRSFVLGNKLLLALLHDPDVLEHLSASQRILARNFVTPTFLLEGEMLEQARRHPERWVLKGAFGYGGVDVVIGHDSRSDVWESVIDKTDGRKWIAQSFVPPPELNVPVFGPKGVSIESRFANWNPWMFGGRFAGGMTRTSGSMIVSITQRGALLPSIPDEERVSIEERVAL